MRRFPIHMPIGMSAGRRRGRLYAHADSFRVDHHSAAELLRVHKPNLDHFRAAPRAPSAGNGVNEIAAQAPDVEPAAELVGLMLVPLLRRLVFNNHDSVHGKGPLQTKVAVSVILLVVSVTESVLGENWVTA
jgi:hypothetical protein